MNRGRGGIRATLAILLIAISLPALAVIVNFPDPGLEAAIRSALRRPTGQIDHILLAQLTFLDASWQSISNLEGIQYCTNLTDLRLHFNQIADISALSSLTNLMHLMLDMNQIVDISALSWLTNLTHLSLDMNQIVDISALSWLTNLTSTIWLRWNEIIDIAPLVANAGIGSGDTVDVRWNQLLLAPSSPDMLDIETLQGRGVVVTYVPQNSPTDTAAVFRVDDGFVFADQTFHAATFESGAADVAEWVWISELVEPGDVLDLDPTASGRYCLSTQSCSSLVGGVVSTEPGVMLGQAQAFAGRALLALIGIVPVKVTNEGGHIQPGDLLVTSSTPGHAMRWAGPDPCLCSVVGKALESMDEEQGVILVLLTAH